MVEAVRVYDASVTSSLTRRRSPSWVNAPPCGCSRAGPRASRTRFRGPAAADRGPPGCWRRGPRAGRRNAARAAFVRSRPDQGGVPRISASIVAADPELVEVLRVQTSADASVVCRAASFANWRPISGTLAATGEGSGPLLDPLHTATVRGRCSTESGTGRTAGMAERCGTSARDARRGAGVRPIRCSRPRGSGPRRRHAALRRRQRRLSFISPADRAPSLHGAWPLPVGVPLCRRGVRVMR